MSDPAGAAPGEGTSRKAKQRAAKRAAAQAEAAAAPVPEAPAPPAKAAPKPKAKAVKAEAQPAEPAPKAKAKAKGKAAPAPAQATPEPKAKAKAKAKAQPEPMKEEPPAPAPKAKSKAKAKAKAVAQPPVEEEVVVVQKEELVNWVMDDGSGGSWETSGGLSKKAQKQKDRQEEKKKLMAQFGNVGGKVNQQHVVGMGPTAAAQACNTAKTAANSAAGVALILAGSQQQPQESVASNSAYVAVPDSLVPNRMALIIGKGGETIKQLMEMTGATILTEADGVTITGSKEAVQKAETHVKEIVEKGYCGFLYEDFSENFVQVAKRNFPAIIGKQGVIVKAIKEACKVEITFPKTSETASETKKYKVSLAGSSAQVERAKQCINNILMWGHDEITHKGFVHAELEVEPWCYQFIIGPKGSQLRHLQNNFDVTVSIPREGSLCENVLVVGEPRDVERAKACIEKILWNAETQVKGGRDKIEATDVWGDEEEEEPWMQAYMYKRS